MGKKRKLSEDETRIWDEVRKSVSPLRPLVTKALPEFAKSVPKKAAAKPVRQKLEPFEIGSRANPLDAKPLTSGVARTSPDMDRKNYERLIRGRKEIDMKVDLHGMTVDQARSHLQARLFDAKAAGLRLVLVVTGKGNKTRLDEFNRPQAGILRQSLPQWCQQAPLSKIVLQVAQAQQKHGGAGAYYVYLRRAR